MTTLSSTVESQYTALFCMYWERVRTLQRSMQSSISFARRKFHEKHKDYFISHKSHKVIHQFSSRDEMRINVSFETAFFMQSIAKIKIANIGSSICEHYQDLFGKIHRLRPEISEHLKAARNLNDVFLCPLHKNDGLGLALHYNELAELPYHLYEANRPDLLKQLIKDPFYGPHSEKQYENLVSENERRDREAERFSKLPWNLKELQRIAYCFPWTCDVLYPYSHPSVPHLPPNLIVVNCDGFPAFRVEVMDEDFNKFRMYEVCCQKSTDYFFDLSSANNRQIDGSDFDLDGFKKIMEMSLQKNLDRHST